MRFLAALSLCLAVLGAGVPQAAADAWCPNTRTECGEAPALGKISRGSGRHGRAHKAARPAAAKLIASWYDEDAETASGEAFDPEAATCAHPTAPFGTWLRVTVRATGRSTVCRVNDRGPSKGARAVDVTRAGARELGILDLGLAEVAIVRIPAPAIAAMPLPRAQPLGNFPEGSRPAPAPAPAAAAAAPDSAAIAANEGHDDALSRARAYLALTSTPGLSMSLLGVDHAIGQLHPMFVTRAAAAIAEARASGLDRVGLFSSYRPPGLGIGGFADKFNSLHAYGLAGDFTGIGAAGSRAAALWFRIATRHGLYNPYGPRSRAEFNHYQVTRITIVGRRSPLRRTVTARGAVDVERMWRVGSALIDAGPARRIRIAHRGGRRLAHHMAWR